MVMLKEVSGIEDVRDEQGHILRNVSNGNMGIASLLQLVL